MKRNFALGNDVDLSETGLQTGLSIMDIVYSNIINRYTLSLQA